MALTKVQLSVIDKEDLINDSSTSANDLWSADKVVASVIPPQTGGVTWNMLNDDVFQTSCAVDNAYQAETFTDDERGFAAITYKGTGSNLDVECGFQPDLIWVKRRDTSRNHVLFDSVRGANSTLSPNETYIEYTDTINTLLSFDSDGFTLGVDDVGGLGNNSNLTGSSMVAWCWKAGGASVSNTDGSITSQVSANVDTGFSIVSYTGTGVAATIGHGLSSAPEFVIVKNRSAAISWRAYHHGLTDASKVLFLDTTHAEQVGENVWDSKDPDDAIISLGIDVGCNELNNNYIAYCWHSVAGHSKIGSYTGNGSTDGPEINCGFKPEFVMIKRIDVASSWFMWDSSRNSGHSSLYADDAGVEGSNEFGDFINKGFKINVTSAYCNSSGGKYIYMAFGKMPKKLKKHTFDFPSTCEVGQKIKISGNTGLAHDLMGKVPGVWSSSSSLVDAVYGFGSAGTPTSALIFGGHSVGENDYKSEAEEFNGTSWSHVSSLPVKCYNVGGCGKQTSALSIGGNNTVSFDDSYEYDGAVWSTGGLLPTVLYCSANVGDSSNAISFGGYSSVYETNVLRYDGAAWSSDSTRNNGVYLNAGTGSIGSAISIGGSDASGKYGYTEIYNGNTWSSDVSYIQEIDRIRSCGSVLANLTTGGRLSSNYGVSNTTSFNGTSYSSNTGMLEQRFYHGMVGSHESALTIGGYQQTSTNSGDTCNTEEWSIATVSDSKVMNGAWSMGGNMITGKRQSGCVGTSTTTLSFGGWGGAYLNLTEEGNDGIWTAGGTLSTTKQLVAGAGTQTAGLCFGGYTPIRDTTEEYNGSTWATGNPLNTAKYGQRGTGTQSAALCIAGWLASVYLNATEHYDGTTWSYGGNLARGLYLPSTCGVEMASLCFGGYSETGSPLTSTEEYNGLVWSGGGNMNLNSAIGGGSGSTNAALGFGMTDNHDYNFRTTTEEYDGISWYMGGNMNTPNNKGTGCGTQGSTISAGGALPGQSFTNNTETYNKIGWQANFPDGTIYKSKGLSDSQTFICVEENTLWKKI